MLQFIQEDFISEKSISLYLLRLDLIHEHISGNKWFKLKYNIEEMQKLKCETLLTFGGAYSNHIAATAYAGKINHIKTIGIIRGEEYLPLNPTLQFAKECGMQLHYISREQYKQKNGVTFLQNVKKQFGNFFLVPEGGANELGFKGCKEIINEINIPFNYITCACGTGTTLAGIIASLNKNQHAIGFPVLKGGDFLKEDIKTMIHNWKEQKNDHSSQKKNKHSLSSFDLAHDNFGEGWGEVAWHLETHYHFGGYAKITKNLIEFIRNFKLKHQIPLDPIYTGKMMYGLYDLIQNNYFEKNSVIIAIHTGGLQGIQQLKIEN